MAEHKFDLDSESVWFDRAWLTRPELVKSIKLQLDSGNCAIAALSEALEQLDWAVRNARVIAFRVPAEVADALTAHSTLTGISVGSLLRHALAQLLIQNLSAERSAAEAAEPNPMTVPSDDQAALPLRPKTITSDVERAWFRNESS